jgi:hypothetical protein
MQRALLGVLLLVGGLALASYALRDGSEGVADFGDDVLAQRWERAHGITLARWPASTSGSPAPPPGYPELNERHARHARHLAAR